VVEAEFPGQTVTLSEARPEILVMELYPFLFSKLLSQVPQQSMLLIWTDEQSGCKSFEPFFPSNLGGFLQAQPVAIGAAVALMTYHGLEVLEHIVALSNNQGQARRSSEGLHSLQAELVLSKGVNVGVVPEGCDLQSLVP